MLSEIKKAIDLVSKYVRDNNVQQSNELTLSKYRKRLFKAILDIDQDSFRKVTAYYELAKYDFPNVWDAVLYLESEEKLADDPEKIRRFANRLGKTPKNILLDNANREADEKDGTSLNHQSQPSENISKDDFNLLILDFAQYYDERKLFNRLQVLFIEMIDDVEELKRVTSTTELLALLDGCGLISRTNLSLLYDTLKITRQFGFESTITEKLPAFKDIENRKVTTFSPHTIEMYNLGKSLSDPKIKTLDQRYNYPVLKRYTDSWDLILDFVPRGLLNKDKIGEVKALLGR
ncbi:uncharacterized protein [Antedon mediterranea]|uniref:uncharacterized protein n=1 Tax=Antedon mediterranea TaxID=105859 RepID=UPI003AF46AC5